MRRQILVFTLLVVITIVGGYVAGCASGSGQPHMSAALDQLQAARGELDAANSDKGGHKARAIGLIDEAIAQVQAGIDFARNR
jgi:hypothetical protein